MVTGEHYAVCFYVKRTWIRLKAVEMGDAVFFQFFYLLFVFIFKKTNQIKDKVFVFFFQMPDGIKTVRRFLFLS